MERAFRARNRLLEEERPDAAWLDAVEREAAELAVAVAAARREAVQRLAALAAESADPGSPFPHAELALDGEVEGAVGAGSALEAEDWYRGLLRENRRRDKAAGRTTSGPNASNLMVRHGAKDMPAALCSTGEQKALLVSTVLAHAALIGRARGFAPLLLLDELPAHLDPVRRAALFAALAALPGQSFLTGTEPIPFQGLESTGEFFALEGGEIGLSPLG
jgi:DNA replication and repair protein RecF